MSKTNYKEIAGPVIKLNERLKTAMDGESVAVCLYALAWATAMILSKAQSPSIEEAAKVFYKDLMRNVKIMEQSKVYHAKAN